MADGGAAFTGGGMTVFNPKWRKRRSQHVYLRHLKQAETEEDLADAWSAVSRLRKAGENDDRLHDQLVHVACARAHSQSSGRVLDGEGAEAADESDGPASETGGTASLYGDDEGATLASRAAAGAEEGALPRSVPAGSSEEV